ncbi:MAG TPA: DNA-binding protein Alba [Candidatus Deferrimicrobium sp.]|nr:DNA-binding protein Alba [Candidatus Deferrimicrobium sp.]
MSDDRKENVIFIGRKTAMDYVMACFTVIQAGMKEIIIKARGRAISRAVDVAEILRNRFMQNQVDIKDIVIGTETIESKDRGNFSVSTMEIIIGLK